jgi:hypothetical protein
VVGLTQAKRGDLTNENNTFQLFVAVAFRASVGFVRLRAGLGAAITLWVLGGSALMLVGRPASAVPPFARQTGLACEACHTLPPELTPFGRRFKLNGYTLTTRPPLVNDIDDHKRNTLWLTDLPGIAVLAQMNYSHYDRAPPDTGQPYPAHAQSDTVQFPDQFSLVYAGAVSDKVGAWLQLTYNGQSGSVGIDNIDIRYSDHTYDNKWVWGVTANNYLTFQDVWNGIGSYTIPNFNTVSLSTGGVAGTGTSGPILNALGPGVAAGIGAYAFFNDSLYFELSEYHSAVPGGSSPVVDSVSLAANGGAIDRFAPYARIAYERDWGYHSAEIGGSALYVNWIPSVGFISAQQQLAANEAAIAAGTPGTPPYTPGQTFNPGAINRYTDLSVDWQYQYNGQHNIFGFLGHVTHERQQNSSQLVAATFTGASSPIYTNPTDTLTQLLVTGEYFRDRRYGGLVSFTRTTGTYDPLLNGGNGSPANQYETFELDYVPWLNFRLILQYDAYQVVANNQSPFNLSNATFPNSPGFTNIKASNNNTWVLGLWMDY